MESTASASGHESGQGNPDILARYELITDNPNSVIPQPADQSNRLPDRGDLAIALVGLFARLWRYLFSQKQEQLYSYRHSLVKRGKYSLAGNDILDFVLQNPGSAPEHWKNPNILLMFPEEYYRGENKRNYISCLRWSSAQSAFTEEKSYVGYQLQVGEFFVVCPREATVDEEK